MTKTIKKEEIVFLRSNGEVATNAIVNRVNEKTNEVMFMEIVDFSGNVRGGSRINGKQTFKRLFVRRVYPHMKLDDYKKRNLQTNDYLL